MRHVFFLQINLKKAKKNHFLAGGYAFLNIFYNYPNSPNISPLSAIFPLVWG